MQSAEVTPDAERPIFIVGSGRSGTTLLRSLLSAHSRIGVTPETHYMKWVDRHGLLTGGGDGASRIWDEYARTWRFESLGVTSLECQQIAEELGGGSPRNAFLSMLIAYGQRVGKPRVGEKSPSHVRYLERLFEWYPEARVIVMQRDPRAVLASKLKNPWVTRRLTPFSIRTGLLVGSRTHAIVREAQDWNRIHHHIVPRWDGDLRVHVVAYESLVRDPEGEMRAVFDLLEEHFETTVLTNRSPETVEMPAVGAPDQGLQEWGREHHGKTLSPISPSSVDKWKTALSASEVALAEGICEEGMARTGYTPTASSFKRAAGRSLAKAILGGKAAETAVRSLIRTGRRAVQRLWM